MEVLPREVVVGDPDLEGRARSFIRPFYTTERDKRKQLRDGRQDWRHSLSPGGSRRSAVAAVSSAIATAAPGQQIPVFRCPFAISRFLLRMLLVDSVGGQTADAAEYGEVDPQSARFVVDGVRDPAGSVRACEIAFTDGRAVTASNAHEWAGEHRTNALLTRCGRGIEALRRGFRRNDELVRLVRDLVGNSAAVLQELVCHSFVSPYEVAGLCTFRGFPAGSSVPDWLRSEIRSMDQTTLRKWLRWSTGGYAPYAAAPINIFFVAAGRSSVMPLPVSHTWFNQVELPDYRSEDELRAKLLLAIDETDMAIR